ncbi:MAG TPA: isoaspartyl peptidase/L-asparaginase family protein, partial [Burkholderiales bacterium]|nr:isoaspartyl peptidase/L-asparaginase family protein [Burkholderiales bacterium]
CIAALHAGWQVLAPGGSALDAVCAAVAALEDDPHFNAGFGSCLTSAGSVEMDAAVMEGSGLRAGAVGVVRTVRNPVGLARALLEDGRHVMLAGAEAEAFAAGRGLRLCRPEDLITAEQRQRWQQRSDQGSTGTVGAAAVDASGHVAAATSTGGISFKLPGRIGDSGVIGAGTYADDARGAASATGQGEAIMRVVLAKTVTDALADGGAPECAARRGLQVLAARTGSVAGIIVVDALGRLGFGHNAEQMTVGYMRADLSEPMAHGIAGPCIAKV